MILEGPVRKCCKLNDFGVKTLQNRHFGGTLGGFQGLQAGLKILQRFIEGHGETEEILWNLRSSHHSGVGE